MDAVVEPNRVEAHYRMPDRTFSSVICDDNRPLPEENDILGMLNCRTKALVNASSETNTLSLWKLVFNSNTTSIPNRYDIKLPNNIFQDLTGLVSQFHSASYVYDSSKEKIKEGYPSYFEANIQSINSKFTKEFTKYSSYIQDKEQAKKLTDKLFEEVAKINFQNIITELLPMNSIKVKVKLDNNKMLIITAPFKTAEGLDKEDVFFTFLVDNKIIISDVTNLTNLIDGVNKVL